MTHTPSPTPGLDPQKFILIAHIVHAQGLKGEVRLRAYFECPEDAHGPHTYYTAEGKPFPQLTIVRIDKHQTGPQAHILCIARVEGIRDRTKAETLKGQALYLARADLPAVSDATYYVADVVGLAAYTLRGAYIGQVTRVDNYGAGPLLNIEHPETYVSYVVPFRDEAVPTVDLSERRLVVDDVFLL